MAVTAALAFAWLGMVPRPRGAAEVPRARGHGAVRPGVGQLVFAAAGPVLRTSSASDSRSPRVEGSSWSVQLVRAAQSSGKQGAERLHQRVESERPVGTQPVGRQAFGAVGERTQRRGHGGRSGSRQRSLASTRRFRPRRSANASSRSAGRDQVQRPVGVRGDEGDEPAKAGPDPVGHCRRLLGFLRFAQLLVDLGHGGDVRALLALEVVRHQPCATPAVRAMSPTVTSAYGRRENSANAASSSFCRSARRRPGARCAASRRSRTGTVLPASGGGIRGHRGPDEKRDSFSEKNRGEWRGSGFCGRETAHAQAGGGESAHDVTENPAKANHGHFPPCRSRSAHRPLVIDANRKRGPRPPENDLARFRVLAVFFAHAPSRASAFPDGFRRRRPHGLNTVIK